MSHWLTPFPGFPRSRLCGKGWEATKVGLVFLFMLTLPRAFSSHEVGAPHCRLGGSSCRGWHGEDERQAEWGGPRSEAASIHSLSLPAAARPRDPAGGLGFCNSVCPTNHALQDPWSPLFVQPRVVTRWGRGAEGAGVWPNAGKAGNLRQIVVHLTKPHTQNVVHPPPWPYSASRPFRQVVGDAHLAHGAHKRRPPGGTVGRLGSA